MKNLKIKLAALGFIFLLVGAFWYFSTTSKNESPVSNSGAANSEAGSFSVVPKDNSLLIATHSAILGPDNALVTVVEFLDPECEACKAMYPIVKKVMSEFNGQIRLVIRYMPFHKNSRFAGNVLEGAKAEGKFWEALHLMFQEQEIWASHHDPKPEMIFEVIKPLGLNLNKIRKNAEAGFYNEIIEKDYQDGQNLGVRRTPTFFINGEELQQMGYEPLKELVAKKLQAAQ